MQAFYGHLLGKRPSEMYSSLRRVSLPKASTLSAQWKAGVRLVNLMMDHEVGVTSRLLKLPKLDSDYFDEE